MTTVRYLPLVLALHPYIGRGSCLLLLLISLASCSVIRLEERFSYQPQLHAKIIDQDRDLYAHVDPLALSEEIVELLDRQLPDSLTEEQQIEKIQEILYSTDFLNLQYSGARTHTAIELWQAGQGNCLSAMNLFIAMARHVGLDANFQTVEVRPSWDLRGDLLVLSQHINATGSFGLKRRYVVDFTPEIALQQMTSAEVSDKEARALYFNNLGVEAMIEGELEQALSYFKNSLFLDQEQPIAWNNIGTVYNRLDEQELAVYSFQRAYVNDKTYATAISNLAKHYRRLGDYDKAASYELAIERFNERNPYYHFIQGNEAYYADDLEAAREYYSQAIRLKEYEPDFFRALARVYYDLGEEDEARSLNDYARYLVATNAEIYLPSANRLRIIDKNSILKDVNPSTVIQMPR